MYSYVANVLAFPFGLTRQLTSGFSLISTILSSQSNHDQQRHVIVSRIVNNDSVRVRAHTKIVLIAGQRAIQRPLLERVQLDPSAITQSLVSLFSICQASAVHKVKLFLTPLCLTALGPPSQSDPKACPGHSNVEPNASRSGRKLMTIVLSPILRIVAACQCHSIFSLWADPQ